MNLLNLFLDLINLFYPFHCVSCGAVLLPVENTLCIKCIYELPRTNFHLDPNNEVAQMFWGRVHIQYATAFLFFQKGGQVQTMLHKLKYKNQKEIGIGIGKLIGLELKNTQLSEIDLIVPVPLHKSKYRKRGYNQSELIAIGLAESMGKPVETKILYRAIANPTQTRKHRYERWTNVEGIFAIKNSERIVNKHILLVDDIITTGATIEASASALLNLENVKVSIFAIAKA